MGNFILGRLGWQHLNPLKNFKSQEKRQPGTMCLLSWFDWKYTAWPMDVFVLENWIQLGIHYPSAGNIEDRGTC